MVKVLLAVLFIAYWLFCGCFTAAFHREEISHRTTFIKKVLIWFYLVIVSPILAPAMLGAYMGRLIRED